MNETINSFAPIDSHKEQDCAVPLWDQGIRAIYQLQTLEDFPAAALDTILSLVGANAGSFFAWDEEGKEFILKAARGPYRDRLQKTNVKLREGILGWVGVQGSSILVKDVQSDGRVQQLKRFGDYRSLSFISIPLIFNDQILGVLNITERQDLIAFSEADLEAAQTFSRHIAAAYSNLKNQSRVINENRQLLELLNRTRRQLKEQEPFAALGKTAAHLAHELVNPLDAVRRYVNLALEHSLNSTQVSDYLLKARKSIRRGIQSAHQLLEFMSLHKRSSQAADVHAVIDRSLEMTQDSLFEGIVIRRNFEASPLFAADCGLEMVLHNLYHNARQAMHGKGIITITTRRNDGNVLIIVEDNGPGIPSADRERVFDPFFSSKIHGQGTGIGLSLCRDIVERSGGVIACSPALSGGAQFVISLPCRIKGE